MSAHHATSKIDQDERTVGINITRWDTGAELTFTVLDLAGQQIYLASHQFFLARRAVYLFAWRARNSPVEALRDDLADERQMVERWLGTAQPDASSTAPSHNRRIHPNTGYSAIVSDADVWLTRDVADLLQHRVPGVPVLLVCTHCDVAASKEALEMQVALVQVRGPPNPTSDSKTPCS